MSDDLNELFEENDAVDNETAPWDEEPETAVCTNVVSKGTVNLSKEKFKTLCTILQMLKDECQDIHVKNGKLCQLTDKKNAIIQMDVSAIMNDKDIMLSGIRQKYEILDPFVKQNVHVNLDTDETGYVFRDSISKIFFRMPVEQFISNKYLTEEEFMNKIDVDENNRIFKYKIEKYHIGRLTSYQKALGANLLRIEFSNGKALFKILPSDQSTSTVIDFLSLEDELDDSSVNGVTPYSIQPLLIFPTGGIEEINIEMYHRKQENTTVMKMFSNLHIEGSDETIPITVWCIAPVVVPEENKEEN